MICLATALSNFWRILCKSTTAAFSGTPALRPNGKQWPPAVQYACWDSRRKPLISASPLAEDPLRRKLSTASKITAWIRLCTAEGLNNEPPSLPAYSQLKATIQILTWLISELRLLVLNLDLPLRGKGLGNIKGSGKISSPATPKGLDFCFPLKFRIIRPR